MEKVKIDVSNRTLFLVFGAIIVTLFLGLVYAYGGSQPEVMGHSAGEINIALKDIITCQTDDEILVYKNSNWGCEPLEVTFTTGWYSQQPVGSETCIDTCLALGGISLADNRGSICEALSESVNTDDGGDAVVNSGLAFYCANDGYVVPSENSKIAKCYCGFS